MLTTRKWDTIASRADSHPLVFEPLKGFPYIYGSARYYVKFTKSDDEMLRDLLKSCDLTGERQAAAEKEYYKEVKELYGESFLSKVCKFFGWKDEYEKTLEANTERFIKKRKLTREAKDYPILHKPTILRIKLRDFGVKAYGNGTIDVDDSILELSKKFDIILFEDIGEVLIHSEGFCSRRNRIFDPRFLEAHTHNKHQSECYSDYMYNRSTTMVFEDNLLFEGFKESNATYTQRFIGN